MTPAEKERIDYELEARNKSRDKNILEWLTAVYAAGFFCFFVYILINFIYYLLSSNPTQ